MNLFLTVLFLFFLGSSFGWVLELFYRRFFSAKKWLNPGFLIGPYLPLYGFGLILLYFLSNIPFDFLPNEIWRNTVAVLVMGLAMTLIEYLAGLIFIHGMKVKLWDYSREWGNLQGIICPKFSLFWTALAALYRFLIHPFFLNAVSWLFDHFAFVFVVGMFYGVLLVDVIWSFRIMARIRAFAKQNKITVRLEEFKKEIAERATKNKFGQFLTALKERSRSTVESLQDYFDGLLQKVTDPPKKNKRKKKKEETPEPPEENSPNDDANRV